MAAPGTVPTSTPVTLRCNAKATYKLLSVHEAPSTQIDTWSVDDGSGRQRWIFSPTSTTTYTIATADPARPGWVLSSSSSSSSVVVLAPASAAAATTATEWTIQDRGNGQVSISANAAAGDAGPFLSTHVDTWNNDVDLWTAFGPEGRQTWVVAPVVPSYDTMTQQLVRELFADAVPQPAATYDFKTAGGGGGGGGGDGLQYFVESDAPQGWLDTISALRTSLVPLLARVGVAPNGSISRLDDPRLSENEFLGVCRILNQTNVSGLVSISPQDTGYYACCQAANSAIPFGGSGCLCMLTRKDYDARGWTQENVCYVLHELAHAAMAGPAEAVGHNLEFFRVLHVLTTAAISLGPAVYDPSWYNWSTTDPSIVACLGSLIGTDPWWAIEKRQLVDEGMHWNGPQLESGPDPVVDPAVTGVDITIASPGA